jgi:RIO kinase 2
MVSIDHPDAKFYFERDVGCVKRFFERKFHFVSDEPGPLFEEAKAQLGRGDIKRLDVEVEASGFSKKMAKELETYMKAHGVDGDTQGAAAEEEEGAEDEGSDEDSEGDENDEGPPFREI